ncbi:PRC-barrel domain-containing protein [Nocardioides sp. LHD-245]|uniref:PRC-barrel domain-containing protein n=1 Tax=Nocardioides sp. LHD-245 TaxID=3051387 RepID=UPI0027DEB69E|nr:PRC-barrel domain-containing protein [Nocardioides sp. LHD-245]
MSNVWSYRETSWLEGGDLVGYGVEATDGSIGKIDKATNEVGSSHVVVDTGPWIFGKKRLVPAGAVTGVDHDDQSVMVNMTKEQIKSAPDYEAERWNDESREQHSDYYGPYSW